MIDGCGALRRYGLSEMQSKRPKLLVLCTDLASIRAITDATSRHFELIWLRDLNGLKVSIGHEPVPTVVLIDNATPQVSPIDALESVRRTCPTARRILITDYCDLAIIVQGLHTGAIQQIVYKPIHAPELLGAIGSAHLPASVVTPGVNQPRPNQSRVIG